MKSFEECTKVENAKSLDGRGQSEWKGFVEKSYNVLTAPNGGYLMAIMLRGLEGHQSLRVDTDANQDCLSMNCTFVNSGIPSAPCSILVKTIKKGKTLTILEASLTQNGRLVLQTVSFFGTYVQDGDHVRTVHLEESMHARELGGPPRPGDLELCDPNQDSNQARSISKRFQWGMRDKDRDCYLHLASQQVWEGSCPHQYRTLVRHEDWERDKLTVASMACIVDANIPTVKSKEKPGTGGWVPTLTMDVQFFKKPRVDQTWLLAVYRLHSYGAGRTLEECDLYDPDTFELLACSRQHALFRADLVVEPTPLSSILRSNL